jgi:hypothetical protein
LNHISGFPSSFIGFAQEYKESAFSKGKNGTRAALFLGPQAGNKKG